MVERAMIGAFHASGTGFGMSSEQVNLLVGVSSERMNLSPLW